MRRSRIVRQAVGLAGWGLILLVMARTSWADQLLRNLACVKPQSQALNDAQEFQITGKTLRDAQLVAVRSKMPRLRVDGSCTNRFNLAVILQKLPRSSYFGTVKLALHRQAVILDTGDSVAAEAWGMEVVLHGHQDKAKAQVFEKIEEFLTEFAAAYYQAGND